MSASAYVILINKQENAIKTMVQNQVCMQDKVQSSNPSYFNNLTIHPGATVPDTTGVEVMVKDWDTGLDNCAASDSAFTISVYSDSNVPVGDITIYERFSDWWTQSSNEDLILADVSTGNQTTITVTVMPTGTS